MLGTDEHLQHALEVAYRYLNRRERTVHETRVHLESQGVEPTLRDQVLETLIERGHLDDGRFVRLLVEDKRELEHWGNNRIREALLARGVDRDLVDAALATPPADCDEAARALAFLSRRFPTPPRSRRDRDRALGVLLRKGYDCELALQVLADYARDGLADHRGDG